MNRVKQAFIGVFLLSIILLSTSVSAIKAEYLTEEMAASEAASYIAGLVDMLAFMQHRIDDPERAKCIYEWYHKMEGIPEKVVGYMAAYPDKNPEAIVYVLAKSACPVKSKE